MLIGTQTHFALNIYVTDVTYMTWEPPLKKTTKKKWYIINSTNRRTIKLNIKSIVIIKGIHNI